MFTCSFHGPFSMFCGTRSFRQFVLVSVLNLSVALAHSLCVSFVFFVLSARFIHRDDLPVHVYKHQVRHLCLHEAGVTWPFCPLVQRHVPFNVVSIEKKKTASPTRDLFCRHRKAGTPVVLQGRAGLHGTIVTVIVGIPSEAFRERVTKHDLHGAFFLKENGWGIFVEPCQQPELSFFNPRADLLSFAGPGYTFAFLVKLPKPRSFSILRITARSLLRQQSRAERTVCKLDQRCLGTPSHSTGPKVHDAGLEALRSSFFSGPSAIDATFSPEHCEEQPRCSSFHLFIHTLP